MTENLTGVLEDLRQFVDSQVAGGFADREGIVQGAIDYLGEEADEETLTAHAELYTAEAMSRHWLEQDKWPAVTDCDRLDAAFAELEQKGIVSRQDYLCCGTCGEYEIHEEMEKVAVTGLPVRGYVFYHMQDTDSAVEGYGLCFNYGSIDDLTESAINVGHEIVSILKKHSLKPTWDGNIGKRIQLPMDWKRRRYFEGPPQAI